MRKGDAKMKEREFLQRNEGFFATVNKILAHRPSLAYGY
jgi:hypothetical protein